MMLSKTKNIVISGAKGFIGTHLTKALSQQHTYHIQHLSHQNFQYYPKTDIFIHLAAKVHDMQDGTSDHEYIKSNVDYTLKIAETYLKQGLKYYIFMSTIKVYGSFGHFCESDCPSPDDAYAKSKYFAEQKLETLFKRYPASKLTILRIPLVYGVGNKANMARLMKAAQNRYPMPLGFANAHRSLLYVENLVLCISELLKQFSTGTYNLADPFPISTKALFKHLSLQLTGKKARLIYIPKWILRPLVKMNIQLYQIYQRLFLRYTIDTSQILGELSNLKLISTQDAIEKMCNELK